MRAGGLAACVLVTGCFAPPPHVDDDSGSAASSSSSESSSESSSGDDDGMGGLECAAGPPPEGCVDAVMNGGLDDWNEALPLPATWGVSEGVGERADGEADACTPAITISSGAPRSDGVVWQLDQDFVDIEIMPGGRATFLARIELVQGAAEALRICYGADPASICEDVQGFAGTGWNTVMAETDAIDGPIVLYDLGLSSKTTGQIVRVDDVRLWVCPP